MDETGQRGSLLKQSCKATHRANFSHQLKWHVCLSQGRGIFASGSPFKKVTLADGRSFYPGQGNNAYVFPGVALGVIACGVRHISDDIFLTTAEVNEHEESRAKNIKNECVFRAKTLDCKFIYSAKAKFRALISL